MGVWSDGRLWQMNDRRKILLNPEMQPAATEIPCFLESGVQKQGAVKPAGQAG
jgi:hypothetical protein